MATTMIDILLATHNGETYIAEQIESIINQGFTDWNLLVSDDGSTDGTVDIVDHYAAQDARIHWKNQDAVHGASRNFMLLLEKSRAPYTMFCDQDDAWHPDKVSRTLACMETLKSKHPEGPALVFTDMEVVDERLRVLFPSFWDHQHIDPNRCDLLQLMVYPIAAGCTMMMDRNLRRLVRQTPQDQRMSMYDWWVSLVAAGFGNIAHVDGTTSKYRQHAANLVGSAGRSQRADPATKLMAAYLDQANSFYSIYGNALDSRTARRLESFLSIKTAPPIARPILLARSGAWKKGYRRKLAQVAAVIRMGA